MVYFMKILLAQIMYNRQLSIRQVSILTGLPKSTIQKVMNEQSNPTIRTLEQLAFGLKIKISDLYESEYQ
ncbi:helix-turn-helix domain-containing protein [Mediterraneibacter gnavus]|uniref:helix-turn-helix domain-containing protein n=1 Tax=Mediterraneibacter gnavus TaxID=33038 RepID=UPI0032B811CD